MKILLIGKNGQIGHELTHSLAQFDGTPMQLVVPDRSELDLSNLRQVREMIDLVRPSLIVNAAAYTAVDLAEQERELAMCINGDAVGVIAREAKRWGAALVHYSTDYVFSGAKNSPYLETDATGPINVYGRSKLAGEQAIQASGVAHLILRTSWVYGMRGRNFLQTVQRLAKERSELSVVADQIGAPTWSRTVAQQTAAMLASLCRGPQRCTSAVRYGVDVDAWAQLGGVYHLTAQGHTTWHGMASAIVGADPLTQNLRITPITSDSHGAPARRPLNSRLSCERFMQRFGLLPAWDKALASCLHYA